MCGGSRLSFCPAIPFGLPPLLLLPPPAGADGAPVVLSFTNATSIAINDGYAQAFPFPSTIQVPALPGTLQSVTATLYGLTHPETSIIEILLAGPSGQAVNLMCRAGAGPASGATITLVILPSLFPTDDHQRLLQPSGRSRERG